LGCEADMRTVDRSNQSDVNDPNRSSATQICCDAQRSPGGVVGYGMVVDPGERQVRRQRRHNTSRKPATTRHAKTTRPKRKSTPTAVRRRSSSIADLQEQVTFLARELAETREQQTATSDILQVISTSPGDLKPVFETMLESATRICGAKFGMLNLYDGDSFRPVAFHNLPPGYVEARSKPFRPHPESGLGYVERTKQLAHIEDIRAR